MTHCLIVPQYSNYDRNGIFSLYADSTWQMTSGKLREMLRIDPKLTADVLVPQRSDVAIQPEELTADIPGIDRVTFIRHQVSANAARTRYDFRYDEVLSLLRGRTYTHAYIMDPMLVRCFKAMFFLDLKHRPVIVCNSHFIDDPSNPVVNAELQYWFGQVEGHIKADLNVWQCSAAQKVFEDAARKSGFSDKLVDSILAKSYAWDAGYSHTEMEKPVDEKVATRRFLRAIPDDRMIVFVPNRMGGKIDGVERSLDYTNAGKFVMEVVNQVWLHRQDFRVIAGNPNQKITNEEIETRVPAYLRLLEDGTFTREEYRYVARRSDIVVGLFNVDSYGGTAWRECVDQGAMPLLADCYEQTILLDAAKFPSELRVSKDISNAVEAFNRMLDYVKENGPDNEFQVMMQDVVRRECSFERTTKRAMRAMGML